MVIGVIKLINYIIQFLTLIVIIKVFLSYFLSPYHPLRVNIDRFIDPLLYPIRKYVPPVGMMDLSPIIFIILIQVIGRILTALLLSFT